MTGTVPFIRPAPDESLIRIGQPVSAVTFDALGGLANWLHGKGAMLVPGVCPERTVVKTTPEVFRFRAKTRSSAIQRVWALQVRGTVAGASVRIRAPATTGTWSPYYVATDSLLARPRLVYIEDLPIRSATEKELSIEVESSVQNVTVEAISCYEQDRPSLAADTDDRGIDRFTLGSGQPMFELAYDSVSAIYNSMNAADARRVGILHWTMGDGAWTRVTASSQNLFQLAVPVLARKLARSATTGSVKWSAYCKTTGGTASIKATSSHSGVNDTLSFTNTTYAWSTARSFTIDGEDITAADGRKAASWDELQFALTGPGGANTASVKSISVWDDS